MSEDKIYTVVIQRKGEVEVYGSSFEDAIESVKEMYEGGDACAELNDASYTVRHVRKS